MAEPKAKAQMPTSQNQAGLAPTENEQNATPIAELSPIEQAKALIEAEAKRKAEASAKIGEMNSAIAKAEADAKKWAKDESDPESVDYHAYMEGKHPGWYQKKVDFIAELKKDLADYKASMLSPEERELTTRWNEVNDEITTITGKRDALKLEITTKYPDFFGAVVKVKTASTKTGTTSTEKSGEVIPFTGTLLDKEVAKARVLELVKAGTTSETDIIQAIYGDNFTINNSKPRFQIHSIRVENGLVAKKG